MKQDLPITNQTGFTLIELLITTALTVMLMLTITTMFMTFLIGNSKTNIRKNIKEEGLHAISRIEFILKNSKYYDDTFQPCQSNLSTIRVVNFDGGTTTYSEINDNGITKIASNSSILTSSDVDTNSTLRFDCSGEVGNRQVKVQFTLEKLAPTLNADQNITENFETIVNLRN